MANIGENIKRFRDLRKYSQEYMAAQLNINQSSYAKIEKGDTKITVHRLKQIAEVLDVDMSLLLNSSRQTIFNLYDNQTANGRVENLHNHLPERLIADYREQIQHLKQEITFLRGLLERDGSV
jgi:transcriptional regulator with XRE-family HTH domain